jgi:hypothetical protein
MAQKKKASYRYPAAVVVGVDPFEVDAISHCVNLFELQSTVSKSTIYVSILCNYSTSDSKTSGHFAVLNAFAQNTRSNLEENHRKFVQFPVSWRHSQGHSEIRPPLYIHECWSQLREYLKVKFD